MALRENQLRTSKKLKFIGFLFIALFVIGTLSYMAVRQTGPEKAFVYTLDALAFYPPAAQSQVEKSLGLFLMIFGGFIVWFVLWTFFDLYADGQLEEYWKEVIGLKRAKEMRNHYIIFGGGRVGEHIAAILKQNRKRFVIVDKDESVVKNLKAKKYDVVLGDVLEEKVLDSVGIQKARAVVSVLGETEKNLLVTLTAKGLNPKIKVFARAERKELIDKLKKAGADYVVMPEFVAAEQIFSQIEKHERVKW